MGFKEDLVERIRGREECSGCPLRGKPVVLYETAYEETEDNRSDVIFLGINPGRQEAKQGRPFVGPSGKILREKLEELGFFESFKVSFCNAILCSTPNEKDIPGVEECMGNCKPLLREIVQHLRPKMFVPVGRNCSEFLFGIRGPIGRISGRRFGTNGNIFPLIHPAALIYNRTAENEQLMDTSLKEIRKFTKNAPKDLVKKKKKLPPTSDQTSESDEPNE